VRRYWLGAAEGAGEFIDVAEEMVELNDYGPCRQLSVFENGQLKLQILTSDTTAPASALAAWLRCRWRIENALKYLAAHLGFDAICDYLAEVGPDTRVIDNPARKNANKAIRDAQAGLADAERAYAQLLESDLPVPHKNAQIPAAQARIAAARTQITAAKAHRDTIPTKITANEHAPDARRAVLRTGRRALQMVLRLLAYNAEHWLASRLNAYLRDPREYRATLRNLLHQSGAITYTPTTVTVTLDRPDTPRIARALALLLDELTATAPRIPGDRRPITYRLAET